MGEPGHGAIVECCGDELTLGLSTEPTPDAWIARQVFHLVCAGQAGSTAPMIMAGRTFIQPRIENSIELVQRATAPVDSGLIRREATQQESSGGGRALFLKSPDHKH
jgi:hypothetical protein